MNYARLKMTKLHQLNKHYAPIKDILIKLMIQYDLYDLPLVMAVNVLKDEDWIKLKLFYNKPTFDLIFKELEHDIIDLIGE